MHCGDTLLFDPDLAGVNTSIQTDPSATPNPHLWIVLTEPHAPDFQCVIVNLTRQQPRSDNTVVLRPGDHPFISKDSVIRYGDALIVDGRDLDGFLKRHKAKGHDPCSPNLVKRILDGAIASPFTSKKIADFCKKSLGSLP
jgi:hypothetical protein